MELRLLLVVMELFTIPIGEREFLAAASYRGTVIDFSRRLARNYRYLGKYIYDSNNHVIARYYVCSHTLILTDYTLARKITETFRSFCILSDVHKQVN